MLTINLLPQRIRHERIIWGRNMALAITLGIVFLVLGWLYVQKYSEVNRIKKQIELKDKELNSPDLKKKVELVASIEKRKADIETQMTLLGVIRDSQSVWLTFLGDLSMRLPKELWISGIVKGTSSETSKKGRIIDVDGAALGEESIFNLIRNLRLSPNISEIKLATVTVSFDQRGFVYKFKMSIETKNLVLFPEL